MRWSGNGTAVQNSSVLDIRFRIMPSSLEYMKRLQVIFSFCSAAKRLNCHTRYFSAEFIDAKSTYQLVCLPGVRSDESIRHRLLAKQ
jgi:hypothetical protein